MYQIKNIHDEQSFPYSLSKDGEGFVGIFITDSEKESFERFKPKTRQLLLDRYLEGVVKGLADGSDELFQYLTDGLSVANPSKLKRFSGPIKRIFTNRVLLLHGETHTTNIISEERSGVISLKLGNVSVGEIEYLRPEIQEEDKEEQIEKEKREREQKEKEQREKEQKEKEQKEKEEKERKEKEGRERLEREKKEIKEVADTGKTKPERQPWWNISRPILYLLVILLAAVAFFVTLLLTGKISLGKKGGNIQKTEQTDSIQNGRSPSDTTAKPKLTKEKILEIAKYQEELARVKGEDGLYGFADKSGKVVIPCRWTDAHSFHQGLAVVKDSSGLWGYIDKKGKLVIPCKWKEASDFDSSGTASVVNKYNEHFKIDKVGAIMRNTDNHKNHQ